MLTFHEKREHLLTVLIRATSLSTAEKMVALALVFKLDSDGRSYLTLKDICSLASMTEKTARGAVRRLESKIGLEVDRSFKKYTYRFPQWRAL
jgi:hypothetical protein|tara:strand:- start:87 stop:365 length:279 start_codon:yes stop_codon:yes gene_type:complete